MPLRPETEFATKIVLYEGADILHTDRRWDHRTLTVPDLEPAPFDVAELVREAIEDIYEQATQDGVTLDWRTARWKFTDRPADDSLLATLSVDVLS